MFDPAIFEERFSMGQTVTVTVKKQCAQRFLESPLRVHRIFTQCSNPNRDFLHLKQIDPYKRIFGNMMKARALPQQITETRISASALNRMTNLGMPISVKV